MPTAHLRIGLLGGSFNPAHSGHLHISTEALRRLRLDQIWWLVSPQNPLKSVRGMAPYEERLASARTVSKQVPHIKVSDFEARYGITYTYKTLSELKKRYPGVRFVWIMGADNLAAFHRWQRWRQIARMMPIAVFDRAPFSHTSLRTIAAQALGRFRLPESAISAIANHPGHWVYMYLLARRHPASSTEIRARGNS